MKHQVKRLIMLCLTFVLLCSMILTQALAVPASEPIPFKLSHLTDVNGNENLIVTILESSNEPVSVQLIAEDGTEYEQIVDLEHTTMAEFTNLDLNAPYDFSYSGNNTYTGEISLIPDVVNVQASIECNGELVTSESVMPMLVGGTYQAKTSSGANIGSSTDSLWKAIERARTNGLNSYVELTRYGTTTEVWRKTNNTLYYKYQFDTCYGTTDTAEEAQEWVVDYNYSHIIDNTGYPLYDYVQKLKGNEEKYYEPNVGGYYYNFSANGWGTYRKMTTVVDLSDATFKIADGEQWNGYMYLAFKQEGHGTTYEGGLRFEGSASGKTKICPYLSYYETGATEVTFETFTGSGDVFSTGTINSDGTISFNDQIKLTLCMDPAANGSYWLEVYNLTTGKFGQYAPSAASVAVDYNAGTRWMSAVSYVPSYPDRTETNPVLVNLRSKAYLHNVKLKDTTLYSLVTSGSGSTFHPGVSTSVWAFLYNTDCIDYSRSGTTETFNIFYDRA